ncbi:hypothetical protein [Noviherbaspirillum sedimenti]|uniref:Transmembrane protein n=1 Tax=Noviherbaspirillum sedimenti TaxID=2320865 RepID=A0A3A3GPS8_9BURK|nr:hypothetical protein [Noviherbaspirillum sedimenti]RJG02990.1 hypothetical protein D3878_16535 [Noviherbaspirillum sedimenti]
MQKSYASLLRAAFTLAIACMLSACSPKFDWRVVRGNPVPFEVLLPAKPASMTRPVDLGVAQVEMTMTAAEVDGVTFAVGAATLPAAAGASAALSAMKTALVLNIHGSIKRETGDPKDAGKAGAAPLEVEAIGARAPNGAELLLLARFVAKDARVYQVLVLGPPQKVVRAEADTFFSSFKPD